MALKAYRAKNREHLLTLFVGATFAIALLLAVLHNVAPKLGDTAEGTQYWGHKYNVFYVPGETQGSRLAWTAARLHDLAGMLGNRRDLWHWSGVAPETLSLLGRIEAGVWTLLCVAGLATLAFQRRFLLMTVLLAPLLVMVGFNFFGFWPLGAFRTNLFAIAYVAGISANAFDWRRGETAATWQLLPAALLVALPFLTVGRMNHARKASLTMHAVYPQAAQELNAMQGRKGRRILLVLDAHSCGTWRYYARYHPGKSKFSRFQPYCGKTFNGMVKAARNGLTAPGQHVYMLAIGDEQMDGLQQHMPSDLRVVEQKEVGKRDAVLLKVQRAAP
jgi:hypothetical protein